MKNILFLISLSVLIFNVQSAKKLPSYVEQCYRDNDKELSACLVRNVEKLTKSFPHGIPELRVPDMDPFLVSSATIASDSTIQLVLKNLKVYNIDKLIVKHIEMSLNKEKKWYLVTEFPNVEIVCDYQMKGKLLVFTLDSEGMNTGNMTDLKVQNNVELDLKTVDNVEYLYIKKMNLTGTIGKSLFNFTNLFKNNEELTTRANQLINENSNSLVEEITPIIMDLIKSLYSHVLENLFKKFPFETLFPSKNH